MNKQDFKNALEQTLHKHLTLGHPIFNVLLDPKQSNKELLKQVTLQGYQLTKHFLSYVEHLFFSVHQEEDVGHVNQGLSLVTALCTTEDMQQEALHAVEHTCQLFWNMYENIHQVHCKPSAAAA